MQENIDVEFVARTVLIMVNGMTPTMSAQARVATEALTKEFRINISQRSR